MPNESGRSQWISLAAVAAVLVLITVVGGTLFPGGPDASPREKAIIGLGSQMVAYGTVIWLLYAGALVWRTWFK